MEQADWWMEDECTEWSALIGQSRTDFEPQAIQFTDTKVWFFGIADDTSHGTGNAGLYVLLSRNRCHFDCLLPLGQLYLQLPSQHREGR